MSEIGKINLQKEKNNFDDEFWYWNITDDHKKKKIPYFYENLKSEQAVLDLRSKIILLGAKKWKEAVLRRKVTLGQTLMQAPSKLSGTKSTIDISKSMISTDISGPKISKNASCIIF